MNWCGIIAGATTICVATLVAGVLIDERDRKKHQPSYDVSQAQLDAALVEALNNPNWRQL